MGAFLRGSREFLTPFPPCEDTGKVTPHQIPNVPNPSLVFPASRTMRNASGRSQVTQSAVRVLHALKDCEVHLPPCGLLRESEGCSLHSGSCRR